ncbi:hypothetical protein NLG97_g3902 [Lecanicillium saksenae]|uniref:Uncharacterized protein n=1 Tax=Lecanicillium saksenae TaxID=468837 RepID=A0ACC1R027_9HYPO|nr:hypothetical protein NLG97_g3902 [Lecanicillium saksenae]
MKLTQSLLAGTAPRSGVLYDPPTDYEPTAPVTIVRAHKVTVELVKHIPDPVEAHQLPYHTTAVNGSAIATVTTSVKPLFAKKDRLLSYQVAYGSATTICTLDSMRAVRNLAGELGLRPDASAVGIGYSGGDAPSLGTRTYHQGLKRG